MSTSSPDPSDGPSVLLEELEDGIACITLNRPHKRNALDREARALFRSHLEQTRDRKVVIITGAGGTFCSGMDLKAFVAGEAASIPGRGFAGFTARPPRTPTTGCASRG